MRTHWLLLFSMGCAACAGQAQLQVSSATDMAGTGMVDVATLAPGLRVDMRYAGSDNFIGQPVAGYEAPRCFLLRPVAMALARVQARLLERGESLVVYDCYRPVRAVRRFVAWARDLDEQSTKPAFYPRVDKSELLGVYIAETSGHSRGATVDLGLLRCVAADRCETIDMGTPFDQFDPRANTGSGEVTAAQQRNRQRLLQAMAQEGFENYPMEWWHFTRKPEAQPPLAYDVPIR